MLSLCEGRAGHVCHGASEVAAYVLWSLGTLFQIGDVGSRVLKGRRLERAWEYTEQERVIKKDSWESPCAGWMLWKRQQPAIRNRTAWRIPPTR